nr:hypothetical protein BgiMline_025654 [Biomphalaria glabrata]
MNISCSLHSTPCSSNSKLELLTVYLRLHFIIRLSSWDELQMPLKITDELRQVEQTIPKQQPDTLRLRKGQNVRQLDTGLCSYRLVYGLATPVHKTFVRIDRVWNHLIPCPDPVKSKDCRVHCPGLTPPPS